jgi:hypothetical protein
VTRTLTDQPYWRAEIEALVFPVAEQAGLCAVHRLAFRTLLGADPTPEDCLNFFVKFGYAFRAAASFKIAQKGLPEGRNFHLTSRDVARKLVEVESRK